MTSRDILVRWAVASVVAFLALSCAGQVPPGGGPVDTTPPAVVASEPAPGAIGWRGSELRLEFSEYVDRRSFEESVFLSPPLGRLRFDWDGTGVAIRFADTLRPNTTYILTVGTDVRDVREKGNRMSAAFALPFSTGDHLDSASIAGRVYDAEASGVMIFAYALAAHRADTLNPSTLRPDFVTQTGKDGSFRLPCLPLGAFRLFAVVDAYKNLLYDRQIDRFGCATGDVRLSAEAPAATGIQFRLSAEDTTAPFVSSVRSVDRSHLLVRFSEALDTTGVTPAAFLVVDTVNAAPLALLDAVVTDTSLHDVMLVTAPQESARVYRVSVTGLQDRSANPIGVASSSGVVEAASAADTTVPVTLFPFGADSAKEVSPDVVLGLAWNEPVRRPAASRAATLEDSAGRAVATTFHWTGGMSGEVRPTAPLGLGSWYALRIRLDSIIDMMGNARRDSARVFHFRTGAEPRVSSIAGRAIDDGRRPRGGALRIGAAATGAGEHPRYEAVADTAGGFVFPKVVEGRYAFDLFRDGDGDGKYSYGRPFPFVPSEVFRVHPDTIKVRARWPVEGVTIHLPDQP